LKGFNYEAAALSRKFSGKLRRWLRRRCPHREAVGAVARTQGVFAIANQHITPQLLVAPLRQFAQQQQIDDGYVLHVFDWCKLGYKNHVSKADRISHCLKDCHGYDFTAQLAVNADDGSPIALVQSHLKTANGFLSTMDKTPESGTNHLDQVLPMMITLWLMIATVIDPKTRKELTQGV
jgi:hypothetical protein